MDLGWLWPIRETIRKGARTFATALANMERYPDYVFGASQPQYFQWMKEHYPALYARIKQQVAEGRIEPQGAMWVEADTNVSGGEALVRQILQGKRFFRAGVRRRHPLPLAAGRLRLHGGAAADPAARRASTISRPRSCPGA